MSRKIAQNGPLPTGWREVKIIDFSPLQRGFDLPAAQIKKGTYPVVYSNGIKNYHSEYKAKAPGVVTGRSGTIGEVTYVTQDYWPHNTSLWVTDFKGNHPKFVFYFLQNLRLDRFYAGSGVPTLNRNDVHKKSILIPTLPEQKAIASLLEKWDTAIEKTEALIEAKERRFKWLLKILISDQQDNPECREVKLGELCSDIAYGYTATASNEPIGPKFLRITDIVSDSINWESVPYCEIEDSKKHRYTLEPGDIVIARTGATTGYNQVIRSNEHSVFASYLIRYKLRQDIAYPFFIGCVLKSTYWKRFVERIKARSAQPGANAKDFASFKIFLPTFPEQKRITNILDTAKQEVESLKKLVEQYSTQKRGLMQKLLTGEWRVSNQ